MNYLNFPFLQSMVMKLKLTYEAVIFGWEVIGFGPDPLDDSLELKSLQLNAAKLLGPDGAFPRLLRGAGQVLPF